MTDPGPVPPSATGRAGRRPDPVHRSRSLPSAREGDLDEVVLLARLVLGAPYVAARFLHGVGRRGGPQPTESVTTTPVSATDLAVAADGGIVDVPVRGGGPVSDPMLDRHDPPVRRVAAACLTAPDGRRIGALEVGWASDRPPLDAQEQAALARLAAHASGLLELRAEASEYRRFVDLNPDAVTVLDLEGAIGLANPAMAALAGATDPGDLAGRAFLDLVTEPDRGRVAADLAQVLLSRHTTARLDLGLRRLDGVVVPCALHAGNLVGGRRSLMLVLRDLTDRIRAEDERARLSEQLGQAQRLDLAGRLASGLAHDLNNHLAVMAVSLELVEEDAAQLAAGGADVGELEEDLQQLSRSVAHASQLTGKLLEFARREPQAPTDVDVAASVGAVERLLRPTLPTGVALRVELEDGLPAVTADRIQLEQAVVNLVVNAIDALDEEGTVVIRARRADVPVPAGRAGSGPLVDAPWVAVAVIDDGSGMDEETAARAFEPLFSTRKSEGGTGLGLAIVQAFTQQVGGGVELRSRRGEGTEVTLRLPTARVGEPGAARGSGAGADILLVDPSDAARRVITAMLRSGGHRVLAVANGEEALRLAEVEPVDLVVTDVALPGRSGWRLLEQLRERSPSLPTIVFTASDGPDELRWVRTLVKPFSQERLLRAVAELLAARR